MNRVPDGLPEDRPQFDMSKYFNVIKKESSIRDETINERIGREGASISGGGCRDSMVMGGEADWYREHKGYSDKI